MTVEEKIKILVSVFDHRAVGIEAPVPENVKDIRLLQSTVDKYLPPHIERCNQVANSLLYLNYRTLVPDATPAKFFTQFMPSQVGSESFIETLSFVLGKLPKGVPVDDLNALLKSSGESSKGGA